MSDSYRKGQTVKWSWGNGTAEGQVEERFNRRVQHTIKGSRITKNGTMDNSAYLIEQDDSTKVLKRGSELD